MAQQMTADIAAQAMMDGLLNRIRIELRQRIMERIEPDIKDAIEAATAALKVHIEASRDDYHMQNVVKILITNVGQQ